MKTPFAVALLCSLAILACSHPSCAQEKKLIAAPDIVPPATEEMQNPEFWINRLDNPDRIVMTQKQISALMEKNRSRPLPRKDINGDDSAEFRSVIDQRNFSGIMYHMKDPLELTSVRGDSVRAWLAITRDYLEGSTFWDRRHIPVPESTIAEGWMNTLTGAT